MSIASDSAARRRQITKTRAETSRSSDDDTTVDATADQAGRRRPDPTDPLEVRIEVLDDPTHGTVHFVVRDESTRPTFEVIGQGRQDDRRRLLQVDAAELVVDPFLGRRPSAREARSRRADKDKEGPLADRLPRLVLTRKRRTR